MAGYANSPNMRRYQQSEEHVDMDVFPASPQPMSQQHYSPPSFSHPQAYSDDYRIRSVPESARNSEYSRTDFTRPERGRQYGSSNRDVSSPDHSRVARPAQVYSEDYMSPPQHPSPQWGPVHVSRFSQQSFETPVQSRSASPTLVSGRVTPMNRLPHTKLQQDSWPNTPMHQSNVSLAALLPGGHSPVMSKDWVKEGYIARLHERDDSEIWKGWKRHLYFAVPYLTILNTLMYLGYFAYRIYCVADAQNRKQQSYAQAWVFIGVEVAVAIPSLMHNIWTMWAIKQRRRPRLRLVNDDVPTVDVFVTCCGEDDEVVLDTVRGACDLDYPKDRFRVIVLDDGKSASLEEAVNHLDMIHRNVVYMARPKFPGVPHHFKAGNLNYGLDAVHNLPGGAGTYMAALDADMIPERDWLRAILPHLLLDDRMALACPPQLFYNTPPSDPLAQSLDFFVHVIEPIKDALGVAWCTGSGYVVRREALDQIGNFPLGSLAEDVATSTLLLGKGWKTAYIHEPLQFGTVPEDYGGHLKQRTRWAIGTVDTAFKLKFCLWGEQVREMTFAQRFSGFLYAALSMYTILLTISIFAIPVILAMGKPLVAFADETQLQWLIRICFASVIVNRLTEFALSLPAGYHTAMRGSRYQIWMSPYLALCIVRSFVLPKWLGGQTQAFKPTGSLGSALNERDPRTRKGMFRRVFAILFNYMAWFHMAFVYLTLVGVVYSSYRCFKVPGGWQGILKCLMVSAFYPPCTAFTLCSSLWVPIAYAIDPPSMPDREALLVRDNKTEVAHPTRKAKKIAFGGQAVWFELEYTMTTLYTCFAFVATFWFIGTTL